MKAVQMMGVWLAAALLILGAAAPCGAQEETDTNFEFGKVVRIEGRRIVLNVFDLKLEEEVEEGFLTDERTVYEGYGSLEDVLAGDDVDLEYIEDGGVKKVLFLFKADEEMDDGQGVVLDDITYEGLGLDNEERSAILKGMDHGQEEQWGI